MESSEHTELFNELEKRLCHISAGLYSCDASGNPCTEYIPKYKVEDMIQEVKDSYKPKVNT